MKFYKREFDSFTYSVLVEFISDKLVQIEFSASELKHVLPMNVVESIFERLVYEGFMNKVDKPINQKEYKYRLLETSI